MEKVHWIQPGFGHHVVAACGQLRPSSANANIELVTCAKCRKEAAKRAKTS